MEIDLGLQSLLWTGVGGAIILLIKKVIIDTVKGKSELTLIQASDDMISKYREEIHRLEEIIGKLQKRVDELEMRFRLVQELEVQDAADLSEISTMIETQCITCPNVGTASRVLEVIQRMKERRHLRETRKAE